MIYKNSILVLFIFFGTVLNSCGNDDSQNPGNTIEEGRRLQLTNLYDNFIIPQVDSHAMFSTLLKEKTIAFNNTPTLTSLNEIKIAWTQAFLKWKKLEALNIGPIQESFIYPSIQQWPINAAIIENTINSSVEIDADFIASIGALGKGYSSIEYLIFKQDEATTLATFNTSPTNERRKQYLVALTQNIETLALDIALVWQNFETFFKTALGTNVNGSQNRIINAFIANLEYIKNTKIEEALNSMEISSFEAYQSRLSTNAITANIEALKDIYTGNFNAENSFGIEDYLRITLQNNELANGITEAFLNVQNALLAIPSTLENSLIENPEAILAFRNELSTLITLCKVDLASAANIIITFNDNDGD